MRVAIRSSRAVLLVAGIGLAGCGGGQAPLAPGAALDSTSTSGTPVDPGSCVWNSGAFIPTEQPGGDGAVRIGITTLIVRPSCHLVASLKLTLEGPDGRALDISGNGAMVSVDTDVPAEAAVFTGAWDWIEGCRIAGPVTAVIEVTGHGAPADPPTLRLSSFPPCRSTGQPSVLRAAPISVSAGQRAA